MYGAEMRRFVHSLENQVTEDVACRNCWAYEGRCMCNESSHYGEHVEAYESCEEFDYAVKYGREESIRY